MSNNDKLLEGVRKIFPEKNIISASWDGDGRIVFEERMFFAAQPDKFDFSPIVKVGCKKDNGIKEMISFVNSLPPTLI